MLIKRGSEGNTLERHDVCACTCWRPHTHTRYISTCPGNTPVKPAGRIRGAERAERAHCSDKPRTHTHTHRNQHRATHQHGMDPEDTTKQQSKSFRLKVWQICWAAHCKRQEGLERGSSTSLLEKCVDARERVRLFTACFGRGEIKIQLSSV